MFCKGVGASKGPVAFYLIIRLRGPQQDRVGVNLPGSAQKKGFSLVWLLMCALNAYALACAWLFLGQCSHSHVFLFPLCSVWTLCMCVTSLSISLKSPPSQPSHAHTVTCSCWASSSSTFATELGDCGTSPEVSEDIEERVSNSGSCEADVAPNEPPSRRCRLEGCEDAMCRW